MDANLNRETLDFFKKVLDTEFSHEESQEMIVPDAFPDILEILDTDGLVLLRGKEAEMGRITLTGTIRGTVVYLPDGESDVKRLEVALPFTATVDASECSPQTKVVATVRISTLEARVLNPRKIAVRAEMLTGLQGYDATSIGVCFGIEDDQKHGIELLRESTKVSTVAGVREKTFVFSDEFSIPGSKPQIGEMLKTRVVLGIDESKNVGNKMIFKGTAFVDVLYKSSGGELCSHSFSSPFSQIIDANSMNENMSHNINLMLTGAYIDPIGDPEARNISVELHIVAQAVSVEEREVTYISDLYSTMYELNTEIEEHSFYTVVSNFTAKELLREKLTSGPAIKSVMDVSANVGKVFQTIENGQFVVTATETVCVIAQREDGRLCKLSGKFEAKTATELMPDSDYEVKSVSVGEISTTVVSDGVELRIPVDFEIAVNREVSFSSIAGIGYDENAPRDFSELPSVILRFAGNGNTFWNLAKEYSSTADLICAANGISESTDIVPGQLIIIPKKR